jgi:galactokinase
MTTVSPLDFAALDAQVRAAAAAFTARFGRPPRFGAVAPGRVNLLGEHTDYNEGFVFPMAIDRHTVVVGAPASRKDGARVRVFSQSIVPGASGAVGAPPAEVDIPIDPNLRPGEPRWANYIRGVIAMFLRAGLTVPALDLLITSNVPLGAGLSSSAALEVSVATMFEAASGKSIEPMSKARLCQEAEHQLAGVPCGIMDQAVSSLARAGSALLIDCGDETVRAVPLPPEVAIVVTNTGVKHDLADGAYARRRAECTAAAHAMGITSLRAASPASVEAMQGRLDPIVYKRAFHVVSENVRTLAMAASLLRHDLETAGSFMYAGHRSLRDDFEVSCPELDTLVEIAQGIGTAGGVLGARLSGGGFGGSTVTLVQAAQAPAIMERLAREYAQRIGTSVTPFLARAAAGAHVVDVAV